MISELELYVCSVCNEYQDPLVVHPDFEQYNKDKQRLKRPRLKQICNTCKFKRECKNQL